MRLRIRRFAGQFVGRPEHVENYFHFVAREVREIMAQLGVAKFDDLIGHVEYLRKRSGLDGLKASKLSLEKILYKLPNPKGFPLLSTEPQDHELGRPLTFAMLPSFLKR